MLNWRLAESTFAMIIVVSPVDLGLLSKFD